MRQVFTIVGLRARASLDPSRSARLPESGQMGRGDSRRPADAATYAGSEPVSRARSAHKSLFPPTRGTRTKGIPPLLLNVPMSLMLMSLSGTAYAASYVWDFAANASCAAVPSSPVSLCDSDYGSPEILFQDTTNTYFITARGYNLGSATSPLSLIVGTTTWTIPPMAPNSDLWAKFNGNNLGANETGLGIASPNNQGNHEIEPNNFVQLDLTGLPPNAQFIDLAISSLQTNETATVWGSSTVGEPGVLLASFTGPGSGGADVVTFHYDLSFGLYVSVSANPNQGGSNDNLIQSGFTAEIPTTTTTTTVPTTTTSSSTTTTTTTRPGSTTTSTTLPVCGSFPFLIRTTGKIGNGGTITGSIGANDAGGTFNLNKSVIMSDGSTVAADNLALGAGTSVFNVLDNTLRKGPGVVIRGSTGTPVLPLTNPFCPIPTFTCGGPDVTVPPGGSVGPLAPGSYGNLTIFGGGTLTLAPGTFEFCAVKTGKTTGIVITGAAQTTIDVVSTFRLANASTLTPASGTPTPILNVAGTLVRVSAQSTLQAFLSAPNALFTLGRSATIKGSFCVSTSHCDKNVTLICPPPS
jgi:hypothetical protein